MGQCSTAPPVKQEPSRVFSIWGQGSGLVSQFPRNAMVVVGVKKERQRVGTKLKKASFEKLKLEHLKTEKEIYFPLFTSVLKIQLESLSFKLVQEPEVDLLLP